jgi:hypothetical protein
MVSKSKFGVKLGAITFIVAVGLTSQAFAANYGPSNTAPSNAGGGSIGYNAHNTTNYRLKPHKVKHQQPSAIK